MPPSTRKRGNTATSLARAASAATEDVLSRNAPLGFWNAAGSEAAQAPSLIEIREGSFGPDGWHEPTQRHHRHRRQKRTKTWPHEKPGKKEEEEEGQGIEKSTSLPLAIHEASLEQGDAETASGVKAIDDNEKKLDSEHHHFGLHLGHHHHHEPRPWVKSMVIGLKAFGKWVITPFGAFITLYGLNVVAWGGMLFLLLCGAGPGMCWAPIYTPAADVHRTPAAALQFVSTQPRFYDCNDINSPRRIWIEIDSQILNALFCVTAFGLVPWRFRDLYYLLRYQLTSSRAFGMKSKLHGLRVLAGLNQTWFRLPGSHTLDLMSRSEYETSVGISPSADAESNSIDTDVDDVRVPLPIASKPRDPLTGIRAPPTAIWKLAFVIWCNVWNTLLQVVLCFFMWHLDRYDRPSWATGTFIALACIIAGAGGICSFQEGKKIKKIEGVPAKKEEGVQHIDDRSLETFPQRPESGKEPAE